MWEGEKDRGGPGGGKDHYYTRRLQKNIRKGRVSRIRRIRRKGKKSGGRLKSRQTKLRKKIRGASLIRKGRCCYLMLGLNPETKTSTGG